MKKETLLVLCHGFKGDAGDWKPMCSRFTNAKLSQPVHVFVPSCNAGSKSTEGTLVCGRRLAESIVAFVEERFESRNNLQIQFSIVGHSFGGIYPRHAIKLLFDHDDSLHKRLVEFLRLRAISLLPDSFLTFASPHLGVCRAKNGLVLSTMRMAMDSFSNAFGGKTGAELCGTDAERVLVQLTDDAHINALRAFSKRTLTGMSFYDLSVPFPTSLIQSHSPFVEKPKDGDYKLSVVGLGGFPDDHFVHSLCKNLSFSPIMMMTPVEQRGKLVEGERYTDDDSTLEFDGGVYRALNDLGWRRIVFQVECAECPLTLPAHFYFVEKLSPLSFSHLNAVKRGKEAMLALGNFQFEFLTQDLGLVIQHSFPEKSLVV